MYIRFADPTKLANPLQNREVSAMKSTTQNAKITAITEKTLIIGIDVGNETHFARAFDWRGYEFSRKPLEFTKHGGRVRDVPNLDHGAEGKAQQGQGNPGYGADGTLLVQPREIPAG